MLCAFDPLTYVGFNDKVIIQDPTLGTVGLGIGQLSNNTYAMSPCSPANFYAKFVSETTPKTYASLFDWSLVLYRSNGDEYVYAQNSMWPNANNPTEFTEGCYWQPSLDVLPAYDWLYDPSGNIYGKIKVTVHIDDGDTKSDETTIGVKPYNTIENIVYDSDMTINACANLNLKNIIISGSPTIIINTNGLGATINGLFEMPIGATLIINK